MSVEEISVLHRRYVDLSDRFRAAWAFHQFVGSLYKVLLGEEQARSPVDFQEVYSELKEVSQQLTASSKEQAEERLGQIEEQLARLTRMLLDEDSRIQPSSLRLFFNRVRNADPKILTQLVKFYLYSYEGAGWPEDRVDKIDFLVTRIAAEGQPGAGVAADREAVRELARGMWQLTGAVEPNADTVDDRCRTISELRSEVMAVADLDELTERLVIPRYRDLKHCLGALFFHPEVLMAVLDTNLKLGERIQELYSQEERRLFADYQRVFDLGQGLDVDSELDRELAQFRRDIERFEERLGRRELSLDELAQIRERMRKLLPRLSREEPAEGEAPEDQPGGAEPAAAPPGAPAPRPGAAAAAVPAGDAVVGEAWLRGHYDRIVEALGDTNPDETLREITLKPEIYPFRLEEREIAAYRRRAAGDDGDGERFILEAAALRVRLHEELEEIRSILDDTATTGEAPIFAQARRTAVLADGYLRRFDHFADQAILAGDLEEARDLQVLRMRFMRDYAGLWLVAFRPLFARGRSSGPADA